MNLIVAADANWGIGRENKLLVSIPADMKFFRTTTTGKVVIMGRKTLESFPGGLPLKNRVNIVITRDKNYKVKDAVVVHSIEEALEEAKKYSQEDVYVIGGDSIYKQMLPYCTKAHVTKIDFAYEADTFFPNLDEDEQWEEDVYVIGGDSIYKQMLPYCTKAHVTKIDFAYEADTFFPNLDEDEQWEVTERSEEQTYFDLEYEFRTYERKK